MGKNSKGRFDQSQNKKRSGGQERTYGGRQNGSGVGGRMGAPGVKGVADYNPSEILEGRIDGTSKGFGFFVSDNGGDDLFVPARDMNGAMHGDRVKAVKVSENRGAGEARVLEIMNRGFINIVGTFSAGSSGGGFVIADDIHISTDIHIASGQTHNAQNNEKVVIRIIQFPDGRKPEGEVVEVLGLPSGTGVDILSIIRAYNLYEHFPSKVLDEAANVPQEVAQAALEGRKDFRGESIITIDGDDSKDFDDAVTVTRTESGYRLGVHIADVAQYVRAGTNLNKEALKRATSVYFVDRVLPMLPVELSNGICSLNQGCDRLTLTVIMHIDSFGHIIKHEICEGVINSAARMTYSKVAKILDGDEALRNEYSPILPMLEDMKSLAKLLKKRRTERGNIEFDLPESKIELDENGKVIAISKYPMLVSNKIIEEFMLAANETVAEHFCSLKAPFVYRAHPVPPPEKLETLINFLSALGISFKGNISEPIPKDFAKLLESVDEKVAPVVNRITLRSMTKATYEPNNIGHFGLAAPFYCHFTSPIRRYPDLMIHRIIKDYLRNGVSAFKKYENTTGDVSKQSSERERLAEQAERKVDDLKKAEFMQGKIGEHFTGVISGVTEWGIFVELENSCEGLIRAENLPDPSYVYNAGLMRLDGSTHSYRLGEEIKIIVSGVLGDRVSFLPDKTETTDIGVEAN